MNKARCDDEKHIQFLIASPRAASATEAARVRPRRAQAPAHDAFTRLLHRLEPDPASEKSRISANSAGENRQYLP